MTRVEPEKLRSDAKYPWARDAEKFIAGAALRGGAVLDDARRAITAEHFGDAWYRAVFQTCCELADSSRPVDMATVFLHLKQQGVLREYGKDAIDIHEVFESAHPGGVDYYAALALDASKRRRLSGIEYKHEALAEIPNGLSVNATRASPRIYRRRRRVFSSSYHSFSS